MDAYRTEEEQMEALRRWWSENGTSTIIAIVLALAGGFGWQSWQSYDETRTENASYIYQSLLENLNSSGAREGDFSKAKALAGQIKDDYAGSGYAQFAALQLAKLAARENNPAEAQVQLRWVLGKAAAGSDIANIAQLRLARVLASSGDTAQALDILESGNGSAYVASYAIARGDIYLQLERFDEARTAYDLAKSTLAQSPVQGSIATLEYKILSLNPVSARASVSEEGASEAIFEDEPIAIEDASQEQEH